MNKSMYVLIDNKTSSVMGIFTNEQIARKMLGILGNERIHNNEFARFAYEEWSYKEVIAWIDNPANMGLGKTSFLVSKDPHSFLD